MESARSDGVVEYLSVGVVTSGREERDYMSIITPALLAVVAQEGSKVVFVFTKLAFYCIQVAFDCGPKVSGSNPACWLLRR